MPLAAARSATPARQQRISASDYVLPLKSLLDDSYCRLRTLSDPRPGCPLCLRSCPSPAIDRMTAICRRAEFQSAAAIAGGELELPTRRGRS
jgi:hypothetical protein